MAFPESIGFKTKPELVLDMVDRAIEDGVPGEVMLADAAFGNVSTFREGVRARGLDYAVAVAEHRDSAAVSRQIPQ